MQAKADTIGMARELYDVAALLNRSGSMSIHSERPRPTSAGAVDSGVE
jgi:hypothetical protein